MVENEIQFLSWKEFQQMTPSILALEITRLAGVLADPDRSVEERNMLVRARFELRQFVDCVARARRQDVSACAQHLASALLAAALVREERDSPELRYVMDRIKYVQDRMGYIY